jgi:hypothetical protein
MSFFSIFVSGASNLVEFAEKGCFRRFDKRLFLLKSKKRHFRNETSPRGGEHRLGSTFFEFRPD